MVDMQTKLNAIRQAVLHHEAQARLANSNEFKDEHLMQADVFREIEQDYRLEEQQHG